MTASIADLWALYFGGGADAAYAALKAYADAGIDVLDVLAVASGTDTAEIVDGAVTEAKLAANAVTTGKIADGTIVNGDISATAAIAYSKLNLTASITDAAVAAANKDGAAGTASMRTLGTGASQAAAGNDARFPLATPTYVRKTGDQSKGGGGGAGDTALADCTDLGFAIPASTTYSFEFVVFYDASTTGDIKIAVTVPTSATVLWGADAGANSAAAGISPANSNFSAQGTSGSSLAYAGAGVGTKAILVVRGIVVNSTNAGNVQLQFAQQTADGTNATTVFTNSHGAGRRIA